MAKKNKQQNNQNDAQDNNEVSNSSNISTENSRFKITLHRGEKFESMLKKMDQADQKQILKALLKFEENPMSIKMKSLTKVSDNSSISMEINGLNVPLRVIGYIERKGNERLLNLFWCGTHPDYDKVVARGYVFAQKLSGVPSKLYEGVTLSDISNNSEAFKVAVKREEALDRIKNFEDKYHKNDYTNNSKSNKYK